MMASLWAAGYFICQRVHQLIEVFFLITGLISNIIFNFSLIECRSFKKVAAHVVNTFKIFRVYQEALNTPVTWQVSPFFAAASRIVAASHFDSFFKVHMPSPPWRHSIRTWLGHLTSSVSAGYSSYNSWSLFQSVSREIKCTPCNVSSLLQSSFSYRD